MNTTTREVIKYLSAIPIGLAAVLLVIALAAAVIPHPARGHLTVPHQLQVQLPTL